MSTKRPPTSKNPWGDDSPEKLNRDGSYVDWKDQIRGLFNVTDQVKGLSADGFVDQIRGASSQTESQEPHTETRKQRRNEFVLFSHEQNSSQKAIEQETHQLLSELKKQVHQLEKAEKSLSKDLSKITVEQLPRASLGIYFLRYLEWLLVEVRRMRMKVEEGKTWLQEFSNKKGKKMGYWQKAKKHGTSFSLSNERTLATQSG